MSRAKFVTLLLGVWFALVLGMAWVQEVQNAEAQYYHAVMAEEALMEAEDAWLTLANRPMANPRDRWDTDAFARQQAVTLGLMALDVREEREALHARLKSLTFDRWERTWP